MNILFLQSALTLRTLNFPYHWRRSNSRNVKARFPLYFHLCDKRHYVARFYYACGRCLFFPLSIIICVLFHSVNDKKPWESPGRLKMMPRYLRSRTAKMYYHINGEGRQLITCFAEPPPLFPSPSSEKRRNVERAFYGSRPDFSPFFFHSCLGIPRKKFAVMCRKYHRVSRKALLFLSLVRHITLYKAKLISTGPKISRIKKGKRGRRGKEEEERKKNLDKLPCIFIKLSKLDLYRNKIHR